MNSLNKLKINFMIIVLSASAGYSAAYAGKGGTYEGMGTTRIDECLEVVRFAEGTLDYRLGYDSCRALDAKARNCIVNGVLDLQNFGAIRSNCAK